MADEPKDVSHVSDPISYMMSIAVELHEMKTALVEAGFTPKEAVFIVGQAVAAGVMLPINDFGPDDFSRGGSVDLEDDDFDGDDDDFV